MKHLARIFRKFVFSHTFFRFLLVDRVEIAKDNIVLITGKRGAGKTLCKGSKVLLSSGEWRNVEDILVGDEVISPQRDGNYTFERVTQLHNRWEEEIYDVVEVNRSKRKLYSCSGNHEIAFYRPYSPRCGKTEWGTIRRKTSKILDVREAREVAKYKIPISAPSSSEVDFNLKRKKLILNPYDLGVYLGDGSYTPSRCNPSITTPNKEIIDSMKEKPMSSFRKAGTSCRMYSYSTRSCLAEQLRKLGLYGKFSGEKFIPKDYLLSSLEDRWNLLAGLIDTDGYVSPTSKIEYVTKSKRLAKDLQHLIYSLGGRATFKKRKKSCQNGFTGEYYIFYITLNDYSKLKLRCKHKAKRLTNDYSRIDVRKVYIKLKKAKPCQVYGFAITGQSKFHVTDNWMITHNSTFAIKMALGLSDFGGLEKEYNKEKNIGKEEKKVYKLGEYTPFLMKRDIVFKNDALQELCQKSMKGFIIADEAIVATGRRNSMTRANKILHQIITINRKNFNTIFFCLPSVEDFDVAILQYVSCWVHIDDRGLAAVLLPNMPSIFGRKSWDIDKMKKQYEKFLEDNRNALQVPYWLFDNFKGYVKFSKLPKTIEERYLDLAHEKKNEDHEDKTEKPKQPRISDEKKELLKKIAEDLIKGEITDPADYYKYCGELDFKKERLNKELGEVLASMGDGRTVSKVVRDNKNKLAMKSYEGEEIVL